MLVPSVVRWRTADGAARFCAVRGGVFTVSAGRNVAVACREGVVGDSLEELEAKVRAVRARQLEADRKARVEQIRAARLGGASARAISAARSGVPLHRWSGRRGLVSRSRFRSPGTRCAAAVERDAAGSRRSRAVARRAARPDRHARLDHRRPDAALSVPRPLARPSFATGIFFSAPLLMAGAAIGLLVGLEMDASPGGQAAMTARTLGFAAQVGSRLRCRSCRRRAALRLALVEYAAVHERIGRQGYCSAVRAHRRGGRRADITRAAGPGRPAVRRLRVPGRATSHAVAPWRACDDPFAAGDEGAVPGRAGGDQRAGDRHWAIMAFLVTCSPLLVTRRLSLIPSKAQAVLELFVGVDRRPDPRHDAGRAWPVSRTDRDHFHLHTSRQLVVADPGCRAADRSSGDRRRLRRNRLLRDDLLRRSGREGFSAISPPLPSRPGS